MNAGARTAAPPLVVDLDGTLIRGDLLHESALKLLKVAPLSALSMPLWLASGKAVLKRRIAEQVSIDTALLPYDPEVLELLRTEREAGRHIVLCTASDERYAHEVARHLALFDEVIASDGRENVSSSRKADRLVDRFGEGGFDYAGNSHDDLAVWRRARRAIVVRASASVRAEVSRTVPVEREIGRTGAGLRTWVRAIRLHQWMKNLLVLLPLAASFKLGQPGLLVDALVAFVAFGLCASSVYILNDLMDLESDRAHPRKRLRPFAAGDLPAPAGIGVALAMLCMAVALASTVRPAFLGWLGVYFAGTLAYTFFLKSKVIVDCIALGGLYTLRVIAGSAAATLPLSFWFLAFSLFLFLSLAFLKRFSELRTLVQAGREDSRGRGYLASDLPIVQSMGIASGFASVLVLALYINGDTVLRLYSRPEWLWLTVPVHLYWVSRMWMQAQRGNMHDDPVLFALKDRYSVFCGVLFALTMLAAR